MSTYIILDVAIACIFMATTAYIFVLNKKINFIWNSRKEFEKLLDAFIQSMARAENNLSRLQVNEASFNQGLDEKLRAIRAAAADLNFLIDRGELVASQLEQEVRHGRDLKNQQENPFFVGKKQQKTSRDHENLAKNALGGVR